jgi:hypothetical protein
VTHFGERTLHLEWRTFQQRLQKLLQESVDRQRFRKAAQVDRRFAEALVQAA